MPESGNRYFIINKPYNMLSQFKGAADMRMLGDIDFDFPENIHAIGRLDNHSEGLLILTTNKRVTRLLFGGNTPHKRTYLVRVKNVVNEEKLHQLRTGVTIRIKNGEYYTTPPCDVQVVPQPDNLFEGARAFRDDFPHTWLQITLTEGKYHQVRKMVAAVKHPCRRLIRLSIDNIALGGLQPGAVKEIEEKDFFRQLNIAY